MSEKHKQHQLYELCFKYYLYLIFFILFIICNRSILYWLNALIYPKNYCALTPDTNEENKSREVGCLNILS